jgi:hypothetical protein
MSPEMNIYGQDAGVPMPPPPPTPAAFVDLSIRFMERLSEGMAGMVHNSEVEIAKGIRNMDFPPNVPGAAGGFL